MHLFNPVFFQELDHRFRARMDMQFLIDGVQMRAHRADANTQFHGDFLVQIAFGQKRKGFKLATGELIYFWRGLINKSPPS
jgi:hypothetical protein